jgi:CubicO group peptidase (beta-lactamase class C family)
MIRMFSTSRIRTLLVVFALSSTICTGVQIQEQTIDKQTKEQLKVVISHILETIYVSPEIGKELAIQVRSNFDSGAYDGIASPAQLAEALTRDLREVNNDKHLSVRFDAAATESNAIMTVADWDARRSSMFVAGPTPQMVRRSPGAADPGARMPGPIQPENSQFRDTKVLDGNIGFLNVGGFAPGEAARDAAAKAMAAVADTDAVIIDLRRCPGGNAELVNFLASYFFDKEPRVLMNRYIRPTGETIQSRTVEDLPGKRMVDTDLYLLVGPGTASACESFSYTLQQYGRAKVVGEKTAGAGYNNVIVPLGKGFLFSVSFGRPIHPRSGKGWEGEGVQPDIPVSIENALATAQKEALQKLIGKSSDEQRRKDLSASLQRLAHSSGASLTRFQDYLGKYGNKEISIQDGGLYYQRIGGRGDTLRQTGEDKFALNTDAQITFIRDANKVVTGMVIDWAERPKEQLKREASTSAPPPSSPPNPTPRRAANDDEFVKEVSAYLDQAVSNDSFSGAVLIAKNGQPIFTKAYGQSNKSNNTPNNLETKFDLGSMNKMFTAVAIAQLVERGKLSFDDTVGKILPDYPNKAVAEKVTIHHLLTHTSGMGTYFNEKFRANLADLKTVNDYLPLFADDPLSFEPGSKWQYSNSGFTVLGLIIEKVSGQSYFDYVKKNIFQPAGMTSTDSYERDKEVPNLAIGYTKAGESGRLDPSATRRPNSSFRPTKGSPAGGGYSTVDDLLKLSIALRNHKLLSQKYTEIITTGKVEMGMPERKYGYGFGEELSNGKRIVGHNGGGPGIAANFDIFPETGYTVIILANYDPPAVMPVVMKIRSLIP